MIKNTISHMLKRISGKVSSETSMIEISLKMSNGDNEAPAQVSIRMYNKDDKSFELIKESFSCDIDVLLFYKIPKLYFFRQEILKLI